MLHFSKKWLLVNKLPVISACFLVYSFQGIRDAIGSSPRINASNDQTVIDFSGLHASEFLCFFGRLFDGDILVCKSVVFYLARKTVFFRKNSPRLCPYSRRNAHFTIWTWHKFFYRFVSVVHFFVNLPQDLLSLPFTNGKEISCQKFNIDSFFFPFVRKLSLSDILLKRPHTWHKRASQPLLYRCSISPFFHPSF